MNYSDFLSQRLAAEPVAGFTVDERDLHSSLFPFQKHAVALSLKRGRAALFEDTGLGKSRQILEWMRCVTRHTNGRALLLVPLAVAHQFVRDEAPAIGVADRADREPARAYPAGRRHRRNGLRVSDVQGAGDQARDGLPR